MTSTWMENWNVSLLLKLSILNCAHVTLGLVNLSPFFQLDNKRCGKDYDIESFARQKRTDCGSFVLHWLPEKRYLIAVYDWDGGT